jgi:hypothetical protein
MWGRFRSSVTVHVVPAQGGSNDLREEDFMPYSMDSPDSFNNFVVNELNDSSSKDDD